VSTGHRRLLQWGPPADFRHGCLVPWHALEQSSRCCGLRHLVQTCEHCCWAHGSGDRAGTKGGQVAQAVCGWDGEDFTGVHVRAAAQQELTKTYVVVSHRAGSALAIGGPRKQPQEPCTSVLRLVA
jgi:hypothetical protein